jgi:hypothetical protein
VGRFAVGAVVGLALLAGCGREGGSRVTGAGPAPGGDHVTSPPTASTSPSPAGPSSTTAPAGATGLVDLVDLGAVDALLAEADRALVDAEPSAEADLA